MRYWIYWNELVQGPFELEELVSLRAFSETLPVCMEDRQDWLPAARVADLAPSLELLKSRAVPPPPPPPPPSRPPSTVPLQGEFFGESPGQQHLFESEEKGKGPYAFAPALDADPLGDYGVTATVTMPIRFVATVMAPEKAPEIPLPMREPIAFPKEPKVDFVVPPMIRESPAPADLPAAQPVIEPPPIPSARRVSPIMLEELHDENSGFSSENKFGLIPWVLGVFLFLGLLGTGGYWLMDHYTSTSAIDEVNQRMATRVNAPAAIPLESQSISPAQRQNQGIMGRSWDAVRRLLGMGTGSSATNVSASASTGVLSAAGVNGSTADGIGANGVSGGATSANGAAGDATNENGFSPARIGQTNFGSGTNAQSAQSNSAKNQHGLIGSLWQAMLHMLPGMQGAGSSAANGENRTSSEVSGASAAGNVSSIAASAAANASSMLGSAGAVARTASSTGSSAEGSAPSAASGASLSVGENGFSRARVGQTNFGSGASAQSAQPNFTPNQQGLIGNLWQTILNALPGMHKSGTAATNPSASADEDGASSTTSAGAAGSALTNTASSIGSNGTTASNAPPSAANQHALIGNLWQTMLNALAGMHKAGSSAASTATSAGVTGENGVATPGQVTPTTSQRSPVGVARAPEGGPSTVGNPSTPAIGTEGSNTSATLAGPRGQSKTMSRTPGGSLGMLPGLGAAGSAAAGVSSEAGANETSATATRSNAASWGNRSVNAMQRLAAQPTPVGKAMGILLRLFGLAKPASPVPLPMSDVPAAVPGITGFGSSSASKAALTARQKAAPHSSRAVGKKSLPQARSSHADAKHKSRSTAVQSASPAPDTVPSVAPMKAKTVAVGAASVPGLSPASMNVISVPGQPDPWAGRYAEAMQIVQKRSIFSGRRTIGDHAKQMLAEMHEKELLHAADTGERLYLPDKMGWSALHQDGPTYRVYLNFSALQADGNRVQARSYQFVVNLEDHQVSSDDTVTLQDFLENSVFTVYHHNPMTDDIESILSAVDLLNKQKMRAIIVERGHRSKDEQSSIHKAFVNAHDKLRREIIYFRTKYVEKILANIAKAYLFPELLKTNG